MRHALLTSFAALWITTGATVYGAPIQVFSAAQLQPSDAVDWAQLDESLNPYPSPLSVVSNAGTFVTMTGDVGFSRVTEGTSWFGDFAVGTPLLWTSAGYFTGPTNTDTSPLLAVTFPAAVSGVGAGIQPNYYGPFVATLQLFNQSTLLGTFMLSGVSSNNTDGTAMFLGALDTSASITSAVFGITSPTQDCTDLSFNCGVAVSRLEIAAVPEPSTLVLLATGGVAAAARRARRPRAVTRR